MATAGLNDRDVIGVKLGTQGAVVQVFVFRGGRVIERFELQTSAVGGVRRALRGGAGPARTVAAGAVLPASEAELLEVALQQIYADTVPPPEIHVPVEPNDKDVLEAWLSSRAERRVRIVVPQRGDKKDMVELAQRNAAFTYRSRFDRDGDRALRRAGRAERRPEAAGGAATHRVLRHLDDPGQRDGGVAGRLRGRPDEAVRLSQIPRAARDCELLKRGRVFWRHLETTRRRPSAPACPAAIPRRFRRDEAGRRPALQARARGRRAVSRSDRDRRREGAAERGV